jgi:hypothetical protein
LFTIFHEHITKNINARIFINDWEHLWDVQTLPIFDELHTNMGPLLSHNPMPKCTFSVQEVRHRRPRRLAQAGVVVLVLFSF